MKNIKVIFTPRDKEGRDILRWRNTLGVRVEIDGYVFGDYVELEETDLTVESVVRETNKL